MNTAPGKPTLGEFTVNADCPDTEYSTTFIRGMVARMALSFVKYGKVADAYPTKVNAIESLFARLVCYLGVERFRQLAGQAIGKAEVIEQKMREKNPNFRTGNTEYLIDAGNFAMIEFMRPAVGGAFFEPTDNNGSPGRVWNTGGTGSQTANTIEKQDEQRRARMTPLGQFRSER